MDDHSAAGPDGMPVPRLKFLKKPRAGETRSKSGIAALHDFVCLLAEGGVGEVAASYHS